MTRKGHSLLSLVVVQAMHGLPFGQRTLEVRNIEGHPSDLSHKFSQSEAVWHRTQTNSKWRRGIITIILLDQTPDFCRTLGSSKDSITKVSYMMHGRKTTANQLVN